MGEIIDDLRLEQGNSVRAGELRPEKMPLREHFTKKLRLSC